MSNNYWQSQNNHNGQPGPGTPPRKSGLLSSYGNQVQQQANNLVPQGQSPFPPGPPVGQPSQQLPPPQAQWHGPSLMARPAQMVQRISNKMAALRRVGQGAPPDPLVRYRPPQPPAPPTARPVPTRPTPWRRSHIQRIVHLKRRRRERLMHNGPGSKRLRTLILSTLAALLLILVSSTAGYAYNFYSSSLPQLQNLANQHIPQSTRIYDRHGTLLYTLYANSVWGLGGRSTPVSYNYLPGVLQDAQIAAEDPTFWTNNGIDPQGILRAFTQLIQNNGTVTSGGSTITQQLIKNLSGNAQDTFQRKASEAALAIGLTQQYPKWKILEMYFNVTPYGSQEKGVEAAVEDYFGLKPLCSANFKCIPGVAFLDRDLTKCTNPKDESTCAVDPLLALTRAAMLAGIPQNPTHFDPSTSTDNFQNLLTNRLPYVLDQMIADGMSINLGLGAQTDIRQPITEDIKAQVLAMAAKIKIIGFHQTMLAPHFVQWVIQTLSQALGDIDSVTGISNILLTGGFNIYTTLDLNLEQFVEKDVKHNLRDRICQLYTGCAVLSTDYNVNDSAVVVMNAKTGEVLAMDGSADYNDTSTHVRGQFNAAVSGLNPGSTMKPFTYATAFEMGWYPGIRLLDTKTYFPRNDTTSLNNAYIPPDYLGTYHPNIQEDVRIALANSYNVPAVKALMYAGITNVVNTLRRVGITAIDSDLARFFPGQTMWQAFGPTLTLGTAEIPLIQMTDAYQTFANNGVHVPYHNILDIWDNYGHNLYHYDPSHPNGSRVFSEQINFLMTNMLSDNYARRYEFQGLNTLTMEDWNNQPVAAKTGTTDDFKDNWTLGYTSNVVVGVWSGNADGAPMAQHVIGITGAGPIWHDVIEYASGRPLLGMHTDLNLPPDPFPQPSGVVQASVNTYNGLQGSGVTDWMIDGEQPQQAGTPPACPQGGNGGNGNGNGNGGNGQTPPPCNQGTTGNGNGNSDIGGDTPYWPLDPFGG
jgi:membrane peptidoglycan carboxypeptidase